MSMQVWHHQACVQQTGTFACSACLPLQHAGIVGRLLCLVARLCKLRCSLDLRLQRPLVSLFLLTLCPEYRQSTSNWLHCFKPELQPALE